ncbi:Protein HflC [Geodia barretti]|uniref:Protein HflC n=1 Tax=Geodia barretti TaxID=519541 RepID=A0AA35WBM3_GEOBA|nr:Protein HflC [Geodia barretti]
MRNLIIIVIIIVLALVILRQALYVVDVTEQVIILRFGEVVNTQNTPGLNVKLPFVDTVVRLDKRILRIDAPATSMPDQDKENLVIDIYARYRIIDAVQFRKTLQTENNARSRLGDIVISTLRDRVALRDRTDIIGAKTQLDDSETRTEILDEVLLRVQEITQRDNFGIEIIDVRIKRADFPPAVTNSIYTRMRAERNRIAAGFRAEGQAQAIQILAESLNRDPELFAFLRSLESYRLIFQPGDTVILPADSPLLRYLTGPGGTTPAE